jgi:hypothetical protein
MTEYVNVVTADIHKGMGVVVFGAKRGLASNIVEHGKVIFEKIPRFLIRFFVEISCTIVWVLVAANIFGNFSIFSQNSCHFSCNLE